MICVNPTFFYRFAPSLIVVIPSRGASGRISQVTSPPPTAILQELACDDGLFPVVPRTAGPCGRATDVDNLLNSPHGME